MKRDDLSGRVFGRWTVLGFSGQKDRFGVLLWSCRCECGTERDVKATNLRGGTSTSCGCYHREINGTHKMSGTKTFKSWESMRQRCQNPNDPSFDRYGARGIKVCERWQSFENFLEDMGERPEGQTLDRIKNDKGYEPGNCRWATLIEQQANRDVTVQITANGVTKPLQEWAREIGIPPTTLGSRLAKGWSPDEAINRPVRVKRKPHTKAA